MQLVYGKSMHSSASVRIVELKQKESLQKNASKKTFYLQIDEVGKRSRVDSFLDKPVF